jgi:hypothetical protein
MTGRTALIACLGASLALSACNSGPSSSGASSAADEAAALERKAAHIEGLLARRPLAGTVLEALLSALPDRVRLTEAAYDPDKVRIKGNAPSNNTLADYLARLAEDPALMDVGLVSSSMKIVRGRETWEFALEAAAREASGPSAAAGSPLPERVKELEKSLPSRQASAEMLRELQRLALDSGLRMTRFAPGTEAPGEFTVELAVAIDLQGSPNEIAGYLRGLAALAPLWVIDRFSLKGVSSADPRPDVRASITAKTHFLR